MGQWLKDNWFKLGIFISIFIIAVSVSYYYLILLPKLNQGPTVTSIKQVVNTEDAKRILELQGICAQKAEEFYIKGGWDKDSPSTTGTMNGYESHYNQRMNKCFIYITSVSGQKNSGSTGRYLSDAIEGRSYAEYFQNVQGNKKYWEVVPQDCMLLNEPCGCNNYFDCENKFDDFKKNYMED
jgi:hypothetical protein